MHHVPSSQFIYGASDEGCENRDGKKGSEIPGREEIAWPLVYNYLVLCGKSEEDLRAMVGRFVEVWRRRRLEVNDGESKVMATNGKKGFE